MDWESWNSEKSVFEIIFGEKIWKMKLIFFIENGSCNRTLKLARETPVS